MTIAHFKKAIMQDGNRKKSHNQLQYVYSQIIMAHSMKQITSTQADKLSEWAHEIFPGTLTHWLRKGDQ